jgi:hypothetical protein
LHPFIQYLIRVLHWPTFLFPSLHQCPFLLHPLSALTSFYAHFFIHSIKSFLLCLLLFPPFYTAHYTPPSASFIMPSHFYLITSSSCILPPPLVHTLHSFSLLLIITCPFHPPHLMFSFINHITPSLYPHPFMHLITPLPMHTAMCILFVHLIIAPSSMHMSPLPFEMFTLHYILLCLHLITSSASRFDNKLTKTDR